MLFIYFCLQLAYFVAVLVGINLLVFQQELIIENFLPVLPYIQYHLLWMKMGLWYGGGGSFPLPHDLFHSTLLYNIHFSLPVTIYFKNRMLFMSK